MPLRYRAIRSNGLFYYNILQLNHHAFRQTKHYSQFPSFLSFDSEALAVSPRRLEERRSEIRRGVQIHYSDWIPTFAGMTKVGF